MLYKHQTMTLTAREHAFSDFRHVKTEKDNIKDKDYNG